VVPVIVFVGVLVGSILASAILSCATTYFFLKKSDSMDTTNVQSSAAPVKKQPSLNFHTDSASTEAVNVDVA